MVENRVDILPETQEERTMAAIAHGMILFPYMGILVTLAIWLTQRDKSRYVSFQAVQAAIYQVGFWLVAGVVFSCAILGMFAIPMTVFGLAFGLSFTDFEPANVEPDPIAAPLLMLFKLAPMAIQVVVGIMVIGSLCYGLLGAILSYSGKPFKYPLLGKQLEKGFVKSDGRGV